MLSNRIIETIRFFDLQDYPLTSFEVHKYLIADAVQLETRLDGNYELLPDQVPSGAMVQMDTVQSQLDVLSELGEIVMHDGFYTLPESARLVPLRLKNYLFGIKRERLIWRYLKFTAHIPFVRGISLAGSQALGLQRSTSDIDLLIITDPKHLWVARTLLTIYFHVFGVRRYGKKITNRFCLNHYLATIREVDAERNLYKAMEYTKLRPVVYPQATHAFQQANEQWIKLFFPNVSFPKKVNWPQTTLQKYLEKIFLNKFGAWFEQKLEHWQLGRIKQGKFIFVREDELSFHPESKHEKLLHGFFGTLQK